MARNGSLQYAGGYCCDVSHYRDAILLGGTVVSLARASDSTAAVAIVADEGSEEEEEGEEEEHQNREALVVVVVVVMVEVQDRGITKACRPSFVAGALTANSKLR